MELLKKTIFAFIVLAIIILLIPVEKTEAWGFYAHKRINRMAVFTLPSPLIQFYKDNIEFITEHAVDPDKRRYATQGEAQRHYIDIDHYAKNGENPFEIVPRKWKDAVAKFSEDTLQAYGIVPWHIEVMCQRLTKAFKDEDFDKILRYSADIGHYIGDAHVPLHTTENYNGQLTNQKGIHGFWESRIPELMAEEYDYFVGKAKYIDNPLNFAWETVEASHYAVDSVLGFEKSLNDRFPSDKKFTYENRGNILMKVYSEEYTKAYNLMLNGMVERRMRQTIIAVGSIWYTCWVNAGKPDLNKYKNKKLKEETLQELSSEEKEFEQDKSKGRICDGHEH